MPLILKHTFGGLCFNVNTIMKYLSNIHPFTIILIGVLLISVGINILQHQTIQKLQLELDKKPKSKIILVPIPTENYHYT